MKLATCVCAVALGFVVSSRAELITFEFTGRVTLWASFGLDHIPNQPVVGMPMSGRFIYDTSAPDLSASATSGFFSSGVAGPNIFATVGEHTFNGAAGLVLTDDASTDAFSMTITGVSGSVNSSVMTGIGSAGLRLLDTSGTALSSDALPTDFDINDWTSAEVTFAAGDGLLSQFMDLKGEILSISRVPETGSTALLLTGALFSIILFGRITRPLH